ncbi:response regulator transcription factor [Pseudomonas oryzihabitans]|uniref:Two-component system capsular synthesis response regulator RcsB n=1 Tax=Pseudomonas oryzihabitans TaxID=47885 RepID=A0AAJ2EU51_9PSED|nr:response regulator transcription factor [Pseudomonas psychrotolerans]MDR6232393.1 two-component system capsular synthesis response regulator RcsB [Pseudomonas psychrotolerans]MDR6353382.1 two-component system capsular synthesis response regulator RcsB [Pseudomonas psychrotolerans]
MTPQVIIADDHPAILHGCRFVLEEGSFAKIAATAANAEELLEALDSQPCDVLIVDYSMPGKNLDGLQMLGLLRRRHPELPILVLTAQENLGILRLILETKVQGIIQKNSDILCLPRAIRTALRHGCYLSDSLRQALTSQPLDEESPLSPRELEIVRLLASGLSPEEVASTLHRSVKTVSWAKTSAKRKLSISSDAQLFQYYFSLSAAQTPPG